MSSPLMPGILISAMRQLLPVTDGEARKSSADEKLWLATPSDRIRDANACRTDSSSSMIDTKRAFDNSSAFLHAVLLGDPVRSRQGVVKTGFSKIIQWFTELILSSH